MEYKRHVRFDWAIKRLLRQKANFAVLEGFLSELLNDDIHILELIESESNQETEQDKYNRVDILVKDKKEDLIIIEIQNSYALDYFLRILYGISKAIVEHIKQGDTYSKVKKIISINIVYFELGQGNDYIYRGVTRFKGIHDNKELELTAAQKKLFKKEKIEEVYPEIYLIKVNKFEDETNNALDEWIYFLKNSEIKQNFSARGLKEANEILIQANMTDQERRDYQRFVEVLSDRASIAETIAFESELQAEVKAKKMINKALREVDRARQERDDAKEEVSKVKEEANKIIEEADKQKMEADKQKMEADKQKMEADKQKMEADKQKMEADKQKMEADKQKMEADKQKMEADKAVDNAIRIMIANVNLSNESIASMLGVKLERVEKIRSLL